MQVKGNTAVDRISLSETCALNLRGMYTQTSGAYSSDNKLYKYVTRCFENLYLMNCTQIQEYRCNCGYPSYTLDEFAFPPPKQPMLLRSLTDSLLAIWATPRLVWLSEYPSLPTR